MTYKNQFILILFTLFSIVTQAQGFSNTDEPISWIETLENGDSYNIEITSRGCFGGSRQNVIIFKEADFISAEFQENIIQLSETDFQTLVHFENELRALQMGGCTTVDTYVLEFRGQRFQTSDGTCSWHGYRKIIALFG